MRPRTFALLVAVSVLPLIGCEHCPCCQRKQPVQDRIRDDRPVLSPDLRSGSTFTPQATNGAIPAGNVRPMGAYGGSGTYGGGQ